MVDKHSMQRKRKQEFNEWDDVRKPAPQNRESWELEFFSGSETLASGERTLILDSALDPLQLQAIPLQLVCPLHDTAAYATAQVWLAQSECRPYAVKLVRDAPLPFYHHS